MSGTSEHTTQVITENMEVAYPVKQSSYQAESRLRISREQLMFLHKIAKRILDISFSILLLIFVIPIFITIAIAIKATSKGPVFFRQERVGFKGNDFKIWKFRTMVVENSKREHQQFVQDLLKDEENEKSEELLKEYLTYLDKRLTSIGRILRASSLDELPQLFNILKGEMSFVGPRPHPVYEVDEYKEWYKRRLHVKPGLTGWSKINLRLTPKNYEEAILFDLWYVDHWSFLLDIRIMFLTVPFVLSMKDAH
ncbi:sugar transferase [candidate division KSB1 bacterium]|nr:sugar transferase [candidate division KSB1 bacterium]